MGVVEEETSVMALNVILEGEGRGREEGELVVARGTISSAHRRTLSTKQQVMGENLWNSSNSGFSGLNPNCSSLAVLLLPLLLLL